MRAGVEGWRGVNGREGRGKEGKEGKTGMGRDREGGEIAPLPPRFFYKFTPMILSAMKCSQ